MSCHVRAVLIKGKEALTRKIQARFGECREIGELPASKNLPAAPAHSELHEACQRRKSFGLPP